MVKCPCCSHPEEYILVFLSSHTYCSPHNTGEHLNSNCWGHDPFSHTTLNNSNTAWKNSPAWLWRPEHNKPCQNVPCLWAQPAVNQLGKPLQQSGKVTHSHNCSLDSLDSLYGFPRRLFMPQSENMEVIWVIKVWSVAIPSLYRMYIYFYYKLSVSIVTGLKCEKKARTHTFPSHAKSFSPLFFL